MTIYDETGQPIGFPVEEVETRPHPGGTSMQGYRCMASALASLR